jgi:hypothetical protein
MLFRPRVAELLINTALLVLITLPLCILLGTALAWLTERSNLPGRRLVVLARRGAIGGAGVRTQLRLGQPDSFDSWIAGRGAGVGDRLFPVSLSAGCRDFAPTRSSH